MLQILFTAISEPRGGERAGPTFWCCIFAPEFGEYWQFFLKQNLS